VQWRAAPPASTLASSAPQSCSTLARRRLRVLLTLEIWAARWEEEDQVNWDSGEDGDLVWREMGEPGEAPNVPSEVDLDVCRRRSSELHLRLLASSFASSM
jgi:hypothetical protein